MEWFVKIKPTREDLNRIFSSKKISNKGVNIWKYAGKVKAKENPVTLQERLRNEWD